MQNVRILLVDDHEMIRESLSKYLECQPEFCVVGLAGDADEAIELATKHSPDVVLMDIEMPGRLCFDAARRIVDHCPDTRLIFLSAFSHDHYIKQALSVKAAGYLSKCEPAGTIVDAIQAVVAGRTFFSPQVKARMTDDKENVAFANQRHARSSTLSPRETEVLQYLARGLSRKEIAKTMHRSEKTVDNQATRLMSKLGIHDRVALTRFAVRESLIQA